VGEMGIIGIMHHPIILSALIVLIAVIAVIFFIIFIIGSFGII